MKNKTNNKVINKTLNQQIGRRKFLSGSMAGAAGLSLRTMATGLPVGFLLGGAMPAYGAVGDVKKLLLGMSDDGESINAYAPGTYSTDASDPRSQFQRASNAELGAASRGVVNGHSITPDDFAQSTNFMMGDTQVEAAKYLSYLPQELLDRTSFFHLKTAANGHPEGPTVHRVNNSLMSENGRGTEEIQSAIMQEMKLADSSLTSVLNTPMVLNGGGGRLSGLTNEGVAITRYSPLDVKNLFLGDNQAEIENMSRVYENTLDSIYREVKQNGTPAQLKYLDAHATSRAQAVALGDSLGDLLSGVTGSTRGDQVDAGIAMLKANLAPVVVIRYGFSLDNHGDSDLAEEVDFTVEQLTNLEKYWTLLKEQGLEDQINFATYDVFGRTFLRNSSGGRDHHNSHCTNMMIGPDIKPGVIGGVEAWDNNRIARASGINSTTGSFENPDIPTDETLLAYARTLMASMGVSEERLDVRIPSGKTVFGAFK